MKQKKLVRCIYADSLECFLDFSKGVVCFHSENHECYYGCNIYCPRRWGKNPQSKCVEVKEDENP
jgi:hypothetical protein